MKKTAGKMLVTVSVVMIRTSSLFAQVMQGEVAQIDRVRDEIIVERTDAAVQEEERMRLKIEAGTGFNAYRSLEEVNVGDEIRFTAFQKNEHWQARTIEPAWLRKTVNEASSADTGEASEKVEGPAEAAGKFAEKYAIVTYQADTLTSVAEFNPEDEIPFAERYAFITEQDDTLTSTENNSPRNE